MAKVVARLRVDRSGGGYLVRAAVKGPTGLRAKGHIGEVAEKDLKEAIKSLVDELVLQVSATPA